MDQRRSSEGATVPPTRACGEARCAVATVLVRDAAVRESPRSRGLRNRAPDGVPRRSRRALRANQLLVELAAEGPSGLLAPRAPETLASVAREARAMIARTSRESREGVAPRTEYERWQLAQGWLS